MTDIGERILTYVFLFFGLLVLGATVTTSWIFGDVYFEQILLNRYGAINAGTNILSKYMLFSFLPALVITLSIQFFSIPKRWLVLFSLLCFIYSGWQLKLFHYLTNQFVYSDIYALEYAAPDKIKFSFPEKKRNLIVLYLESIEEDYTDSRLTGDNLLPELSHMDAVSFKGFYQLPAQDYTIAALVESFCGVPYKASSKNSVTDLQSFLSGLICFPQILKENGYQTYFMKGADLDFARTGLFLQEHGFTNMKGRDELQAVYKIDGPAFQGTSWGLNDRTLYQIAKRRLRAIAQKGEPFMFSLITLDTHEPDVYLDKQCEAFFYDKRDVILCADKMAAEFINWVKLQDFYKNTTLVVVGDHPVTGGNSMYPQAKERRIVNLFFNADAEAITLNRQWTTLDLAPTMLAAMGIKFEGNTFGLGRSLFGDDMTLREVMGYALDTELMKNSKEYENFDKSAQKLQPLYTAYPRWNEAVSSPQKIKQYAAFPVTYMNATWTDNLSFTLPPIDKTEIIFDVSFRALFSQSRSRRVDVFVNGQKVTEWNLSVTDKQPVRKSLTILKSQIGSDHKVLIEFKGDNSGFSAVAIGLNILDFKWKSD